MGRFMFAVVSGIGRERQFDTEKRTMTERAEGGNLALVCRANRFHNGESKTGTAEFPGPCFVDTEKTLENPGQRIGWNAGPIDRKSTRLNSSHVRISYAVFCLKKKNKET